MKSYAHPCAVSGYDIREVVAEKCRAILTRRVPKGRDLLDLYLIERDLGVRVEDLQTLIEEKLEFALGLGEKYRINHTKAPNRLKQLAHEDIRTLLLKKIDYDAFDSHRSRVLDHITASLQ